MEDKSSSNSQQKAVEFHQSEKSDCNDSDATPYIYPFDDVDLPDPKSYKNSLVLQIFT